MAFQKSDNWKVTSRLATSWDVIVGSIPRIHSAAELHPSSYADAFTVKITDDGNVDLAIGPIVMFVPEKGRTLKSSMYVVICGTLLLAEGPNDTLQTLRFSGEIGYFRTAADAMVHVHGMRCDLDEDNVAHPKFHVQFEPFPEMRDHVATHFSVPDDVDDKSPDFSRISTIRIPTAQLDPFALVAQVCADHLLHGNSDDAAHAAINDVIDAFAFIGGAAYRMPLLNSIPGSACYRSSHWYNRG